MNIIPENLSTFGNADLRRAEALFAKRNKIKYYLLDKFQRAHTLYSCINSLATPLPPVSMPQNAITSKYVIYRVSLTLF